MGSDIRASCFEFEFEFEFSVELEAGAFTRGKGMGEKKTLTALLIGPLLIRTRFCSL
jgi:hypothetical protein